MANIQPFDYQKSTNIEEHNQIVNKVNEIVRVINDVNLDTINSEIANLQSKATATDTEIANIKNKDSMQDTEIVGIDKSLISDVTATFDNPSRELKISVGKKDSTSIDATVVIPSSSETGQYSAGNGITIENYQIAVDTNVVALKSDIPVVPDVSGINNRLDTIDGEITGINADITNLTNKNTEQDTAINGKVAIAQGTENAGKVLGIGVDGNVTPVNAGGSSGGGEVWEEVDLNNWATDWKVGDRINITTKLNASPGGGVGNGGRWSPIIEFYLGDSTSNAQMYAYDSFSIYALEISNYSHFNGDINSTILISSHITSFSDLPTNTASISRSQIASYGSDYTKIWRLKQSS